MTPDPSDRAGGLRHCRVVVEWHGGPTEIERLFSALAHLEPALVSGTRNVAVEVAAEDQAQAEEYVSDVLRRERLAAAARVAHQRG